MNYNDQKIMVNLAVAIANLQDMATTETERKDEYFKETLDLKTTLDDLNDELETARITNKNLVERIEALEKTLATERGADA